ncbi:dolichol-phosphate mannosyltransferase subunit 3 [Trichosurus vulpecula]|uniref:dolichol-phosphate mannosyltransferase subunit 3 n=1 Tax=Trichosurus vulpecula TaxID=9337 RepID=UPI00186AF4AA|nr:dolichol-phosphate mannosyltransferase subunit 3 [Trichosurus vulpecula]
MTKLEQWVSTLLVLMLIWLCLVQDLLNLGYSKQFHDVILPLPVYLLVTAGSYTLGTLGLRLANFSDCEEAAQELFTQIKEAQADLASKGLTL